MSECANNSYFILKQRGVFFINYINKPYISNEFVDFGHPINLVKIYFFKISNDRWERLFKHDKFMNVRSTSWTKKINQRDKIGKKFDCSNGILFVRNVGWEVRKVFLTRRKGFSFLSKGVMKIRENSEFWSPWNLVDCK